LARRARGAPPVTRRTAASERPDATPVSKSTQVKPAAPDHLAARAWPQSEPVAVVDEALKEFREVAGQPYSRGGSAGHLRSAPPLQPAALAPRDPLEVLESFASRLPQDDWRTPAEPSVREMPASALERPGAKIPPPVHEGDESGAGLHARRWELYRRPILILLALLAFAGMAGVGYWQSDAIMHDASNFVSMFRKPVTQAQKSAAPPQQKITDRVGQPGNETSSSALALTQRAMLTTEPDANNPRGRDHVGTAIWRLETIPAGQGRAAEVAIKLEVEIPERGFAMSWLIRRNTDAALPASHTIDIEFKLAPNSPLGSIAEIRSLLMKQPGQTEGAPLWGHAQKSTPTFFLVGLSATEADARYNIKLLKEQPAFDMALVFANAQRAFLLIEKGPAGERVFADAFAAWKQ
jgi:hypothetical protein